MSRTRAAHDIEYGSGSTATLEYQVFRDNYGDSFSYFYAPLIIEELYHVLKPERNDEIRFVLAKLSNFSHEFVVWVSRD